MVAGAMDLARQPTHTTLVFLQLLTDETSDWDAVCICFHCLGFRFGFSSISQPQKNSVNTIYYVTEGSGKPVTP